MVLNFIWEGIHYMKLRRITEKKEPSYGKAIILTALTVAAIEMAAVIAYKVIKGAVLSKREADQEMDDDFDIRIDDGDCKVSFEASEDTAEVSGENQTTNQ